MKKVGIDDLEAALKLNVGRWHEDIFQMAMHQALATLALDDPAWKGSGCGRLSFPVCGVMCGVTVDIYMSPPRHSHIMVFLNHDRETAVGHVVLGGASPTQSDYWIALAKAVNELGQISAEFRRDVEDQIRRNKSMSHD